MQTIYYALPTPQWLRPQNQYQKIVEARKFQKNIVCLLPIVENMIDANATRPGDVIKMYNKKTDEVTDTYAEGRLIMADAIAFSKKTY